MIEGTSITYGVVRIGKTAIGIPIHPIDNLSEVFHISNEQELPIKSDLLHCGVDLRGRLVPVLNLSFIGSFGHRENDAHLGFVLEHAKKSLAFYVDEIVGIATVSPDQIGEIAENQSTRTSFFGSVFPFENQFVSILDVSAVFAIPGVLAANRTEGSPLAANDKGPPMLTFMAGGALYSLPAVEVHAAVPEQKIEETAIASGPCLGEISYHNRRIPVVCPITILGLGKRQYRSASEVVVLRFADDFLLGIAVDAIRDIRTFHTAKEARIPIWQAGPNFIHSVLVHDDGEQTYVVDVDLLRRTQEVADIASLFRIEEDKAVEDDEVEVDQTTKKIIKERKQYLIVDLHKRLAIPLLQVTCILEKPKNLTPTNLNMDGFRGYFSRLGETVALIDLRERLGAGQVQNEKAKVLMTGQAGAQIGFLVDHVVGIELSQWRESQTEKSSAKQNSVVQLGTGGTLKLLPFFNLSSLTEVNLEPV